MTTISLKQHLNNENITLVHVVAIDNCHCIGKDNELCWHVPEDLKHFKALTTGGVVIMGKKTFLSIGKALPDRTNWVITRDKHWQADGVKVAHSLEDAIRLASLDAKNDGQNQLFIIGGGEIYRQSLEFSDILEITRVDLDVDGDTFYPDIPDDFVLMHSERGVSRTGIGFCFESYQRK